MRTITWSRVRFSAAFFVIILAVSPAFVRAAFAESASDPAEILVIHSYHPSFEWTMLIHDGLVHALGEWNEPVKLSVEYMDTKRINTPEHIAGLVTLYRAKYRDNPPDVVICSDNNAFKTLFENRDVLFGPEVPLVACGVNFFDPGDWPGMTGFIGVDERPDLEATISLIDTLHPGAAPIAFINDRSPTGLAFRKGFEELVAERDDAERFLLLDEGTPDDIMDAVNDLPEGAVIHYSSYVLSPEGILYQPEDLLERCARETRIPIYGNYTFMIGHGIIGGPVIDGRLQGSEAAALAIGILENRIDPTGYEVAPSPYSYQFDYRRMKDFRIRGNDLPEGSIVHGEPDVFWKEYPAETGLVAAVVFLLVMGLAVTFRLLNQRAALLDGIRKLNTDLEERVRKRTEELKRAETILIRNEKLASLGSLVVGIAHEVNTPLGTALTASSYLKEQFVQCAKPPSGADSEKDIAKLVESGLEISAMIERNIRKAAAQISAFRQVAVDQTGEKPRQFTMSTLIEEFLLSMKNELKKAWVGVDVDCPEDIVLTHFPGDIWRILANLLMNSLKHAFPDGGEGLVSIRVRLSGDSVEIRYSDNGIGVPAARSSQLFDPFFTTARESGGLGLGLHLVRSIIVDRHGGSIAVESAPGSGLSYRIVLPVISPALTMGAGEAEDAEQGEDLDSEVG